MSNPTFINRKTEDDKDYIAIANDEIKRNGSIDPSSPTYKSALIQYNEGLIKGSVERLDVPKGFCGYIDPKSGEFRVEPEPDPSILRSSTPYPDNIINPEDVPESIVSPYPIDECLAIGLPGSPEYTRGNCGEEDGDNECSTIDWFTGAASGGSSGSSSGGSGSQGSPNLGLTQNVTISFGSSNSSSVSWSGTTPPATWPEIFVGHANVVGTVHLFRNINGNWVGGKFEWFRRTQQSVGSKNILEGYGGHSVPNAGETIAIMLVSSDNKYRSNLVTGVWSSNSSAGGDIVATASAEGFATPVVCGNGPGINSNTGLASSGAVAGLSSYVPPEVRQVCDTLALSLYSCAGFVRGKSTPGDKPLLVYKLYYNVNDPCTSPGYSNFKPEGLIISVDYNTETKKPIEPATFSKNW